MKVPSVLQNLLGTVIVVAAFCACERKAPPAVPLSSESSTATSTQIFQVKGIVREVFPERMQVKIDHEKIPNYMDAMTMTFDPHTQYYAPRAAENFNMSMRLSLEGIGAVLTTEDEYTKVVSIVTGGPADTGGEPRTVCASFQ